MDSLTSLGEGEGLKSGNRSRGDYWNARTFELGNQLRAKKDAQARQDENDLIKLTDLNVKYDNLLPVYANAIANEQATLLNNYVRYKQDNPRTAKNRLMMDVNNAQRKVGSYMTSNAAALKYLDGKDHRVDETIARGLTSFDTKISDLQKYDDGVLHRFGAGGEFSWTPVSNKDVEVKFNTATDYSEGNLTGKTDRIGNVRRYQVQDLLKQDALEREANRLALDGDFQLQTVWDKRKELRPLPNETPDQLQARQSNITKEYALEKAKSLAQMGKTDWMVMPQPPSSSSSDKKESLSPQFNVSTKITDKKTGQVTDDVKAVVINTPSAKEVSFTNSNDVFDVETNRAISGGSQNYKFKPTGVEYRMIDKNGKKERKWYATGVATDEVTEQEYKKILESEPQAPVFPSDSKELPAYNKANEQYKKDKLLWDKKYKGIKEGVKKTTFNVMVPLNAVEGAFREKYDLSQLDKIASDYDAKAGGVKELTTKTGVSKNNKIGVKPKM